MASAGSGSAIGAEGRRRRDTEPFVRTSTPPPAAPDLKEAAAAVQAPDGPDQDKVGKDGVLKEHSFTLEHIDTRGRRWTGQFRCHALTYRERISIGLIRSRMSGGVAPHLLDVTTSNLLEMLAHLSVALDDGPPWARDLESIHDPGVVTAIYKEVLEHEQRFHEAGPRDPGPSDDAGTGAGDGEGVPGQDG